MLMLILFFKTIILEFKNKVYLMILNINMFKIIFLDNVHYNSK